MAAKESEAANRNSDVLEECEDNIDPGLRHVHLKLNWVTFPQCMNGYNLVSRFFGFRHQLRQHKIAAYIPDVTDLSSWVNSRKTSDEITMGLASVSLIFDVLLFTGAARESGATIQLAGLWGSIDCVVDAVIGFLSANYTPPAFVRNYMYTPACLHL
ncbi:uncharacterized protein LOC119392021 [Rhipicephalus sanguineus]|uniref:uncharacterized protein LOC119392021 n=1 Tax=Rhipicephalus sanguineus TaxID=34632 RepID=UPI0020C55D8B|nr:uncharacterized protein LOC119392021 [Rhipicephalus sanguineus]